MLEITDEMNHEVDCLLDTFTNQMITPQLLAQIKHKLCVLVESWDLTVDEPFTILSHPGDPCHLEIQTDEGSIQKLMERGFEVIYPERSHPPENPFEPGSLRHRIIEIRRRLGQR